jgi:hypothetical protein
MSEPLETTTNGQFTLFDLIALMIRDGSLAACAVGGWLVGGWIGAAAGIPVGWLVGWVARYVVFFILAGILWLCLGGRFWPPSKEQV